MAERVSSTGLPITWEWCKRHDWKSEKVVCPFCRAERAERERDEARKALARFPTLIEITGALVPGANPGLTARLIADYNSAEIARAADGGERMSEESRHALLRKMVRWQRAKLDLNWHKGDNWRACDLGWLLRRLEEEVRELSGAVLTDNAELIWSEAADVANIAAMVADRACAEGGEDE